MEQSSSGAKMITPGWGCPKMRTLRTTAPVICSFSAPLIWAFTPNPGGMARGCSWPLTGSHTRSCSRGPWQRLLKMEGTSKKRRLEWTHCNNTYYICVLGFSRSFSLRCTVSRNTSVISTAISPSALGACSFQSCTGPAYSISLRFYIYGNVYIDRF